MRGLLLRMPRDTSNKTLTHMHASISIPSRLVNKYKISRFVMDFTY